MKTTILVSPAAIVCLSHSQPSDEALLTVEAARPLDNPDGMSGGSAFVIQLEHGQPRAYFAGIIVRGGRNSFTILKAGFVIAFLNGVFGTAARLGSGREHTLQISRL